MIDTIVDERPTQEIEIKPVAKPLPKKSRKEKPIEMDHDSEGEDK